MLIVIAMAGEGKRFIDRGFLAPKYELIAKDRPLFDWALSSLSCYFDNANFLFVAREGAQPYINSRCQKIGIEHFEITTLNYRTDGQATSVLVGTESISGQSPLLIFNIDTFIQPTQIKCEDIGQNMAGWLQLFQAPGEQWSFARIDVHNKVLEVSEKIRISDYASTGLYYFSSLDLFRRIHFEHKSEIKARYREVYVAPMYEYLIKEGLPVGSKTIPFESVTPLGTPDEVLRFDNSFFHTYSVIE